MKEIIEINTMTARNVYTSESFRFIKMVVEKICNIQVPEKAKEIHKQNKPHDYTDEFRLYGTKEQGINYHSYYKVVDKENLHTTVYTISNQAFGYPDIDVKFTISTQDGLILEIESNNTSTISKIKELFEEEFGYCRKQSQDEIFDELIHEMRIRGTEEEGKVGIKLGLEAIQIDPNDFWAQFYLGCSYAFNNQHTKAIEHLRKSINLDPSNYDAYYNLARSYIELHKYTEAKEVLMKAKSLSEKNHVITYYLAFILDKLGQTKEAIKYYQEAIALAPENVSGTLKPIVSFLEEAKNRIKQLM
ncbi:MAG: tetratricopeptide repeat protein [Candidatus Thorarchaeota archaeon]